MSGLTNIVGGEVKGIQVGGLVNNARNHVQELQLSGITNICLDSVKGVQTSGLFNLSKGTSDSVQITGFTNLSYNLNGSQICAGINYAKDVTGIQVSLLNLAKNVTLPN